VKAPEMVQNPGVLDDRLTPNPTLSHVAIVVDVDANTITTYYDGEQVTQKSFPAGHLAAMDCGYIGPDAFVALNFKPQYGDPQNTINSGSMTGRVADWRMYVGSKLSSSEIINLAENSKDSSGVLYRECANQHTADDSNFLDTAGVFVFQCARACVHTLVCVCDSPRRHTTLSLIYIGSKPGSFGGTTKTCRQSLLPILCLVP